MWYSTLVVRCRSAIVASLAKKFILVHLIGPISGVVFMSRMFWVFLLGG